MPKPVYWNGSLPDVCQISKRPFNGVMYDAHIPGAGWANINHDAFVRLGCSLGVGRGQKYELQDDGRWLCTAGSAGHAAEEAK